MTAGDIQAWAHTGLETLQAMAVIAVFFQGLRTARQSRLNGAVALAVEEKVHHMSAQTTVVEAKVDTVQRDVDGRFSKVLDILGLLTQAMVPPDPKIAAEAARAVIAAAPPPLDPSIAAAAARAVVEAIPIAAAEAARVAVAIKEPPPPARANDRRMP